MGKLSESNIHRLAAWSSKFIAYRYNMQNPIQSHKVCSKLQFEVQNIFQVDPS